MEGFRASFTSGLIVLLLLGRPSAGIRIYFHTPQGTTPGTPTTLHEDTTAQTELAIIDCIPDFGQCICNLDSTVPTNGPFDVWRLHTQTLFKVYFVGTAHAKVALDYSVVRTYDVVVRCRDDNNYNETAAILEVDILPNQVPVITGYPAVATPTFDAQSGLAIGSPIYQINVMDPEGDPLTFSMSQDPDSGYLTIGGDGIIRTNVDLRTVTVDTIICSVVVSDGQNTLNPFIVTVQLTNLNTRPVITNLPATVKVMENRGTSFTLITLTYTDSTPQGVTLEPDCTVDPVSESYKFTYETDTRRIVLNTIAAGDTLLDYETNNQYLITCVVFDGYLSSAKGVLTVDINNVNEPPLFNQNIYYCTLLESLAGVNSCHLGLTVTDPESNSIPILELLQGNNSERFRYNRQTDRLTFNVDYDVDNNLMPTSVIITIYAVDTNAATGTAKIDITIQDANDNRCDFGSLHATQFYIDQGTPMQTLGSFFARDDDLTSPNNQISYQVISGFPATSTNYLTVFPNGDIQYIGLIPERDNGKSFGLRVLCRDGGTPSMSSTATVLVSYITTTTTTTTTTPTTTTQAPSSNVFNNTAFVIVSSILTVLFGIGLLAAVWYCCCRGNSGGFNDFMGPRYFRNGSSRVFPDYRDKAGRTGDHFEDGLGYDGRPLPENDIFVTDSSRPQPSSAQGQGRGGSRYL